MYKKALIAALISCMTVSAAGCQMNSTKTDTIPDSTADINAAPTAEPAEGESWAEPVVLVKGESTRLPLPALSLIHILHAVFHCPVHSKTACI